MQAHFHYIYLISSNHYHIAIDITLQITLLVWNHSSFSAQNILILLSLTLLGNLLHSLTGYITCHLFYVIWNEHFYFSFGVKLARNAKIFLFFQTKFQNPWYEMYWVPNIYSFLHWGALLWSVSLFNLDLTCMYDYLVWFFYCVKNQRSK